MDPITFSKWMHYVWNSGQDFRTQHFLGGAVHGYLRKFPGTIEPPKSLMDVLLSTPDADARIVGAKLAGELLTDFSDLWRRLAPLIIAGSEDERLGALYALVEALHKQLMGQRAYSRLEIIREVRLVCEKIDLESFRPETGEMLKLALSKLSEIEQLAAR